MAASPDQGDAIHSPMLRGGRGLISGFHGRLHRPAEATSRNRTLSTSKQDIDVRFKPDTAVLLKQDVDVQ